MKYVYADGSPVPADFCIMPDNVTQVFTIRVRSSRGIGLGQLMDLVQTKFEVAGITEGEGVTVVQNAK